MGAIGSYMKIAVSELENTMRDLGKDINCSEVTEIVQHHAIAGAASAVGSALLPGAGALVATGAAAASVFSMYVRLAKSMGVTFGNGTLKALASGIVADLSATVVANIAVAVAVSFIPVVGQASAVVLSTIANYSMIYLAAYIFIKMLAKLLKSRKNISAMSNYELKNYASSIYSSVNLKDVVKEAKSQYKQNK